MKNYGNKIIDLVLEGKSLTFTNLGIGQNWPEVEYPDGYKPEVQNPTDPSDERTATDYGDLAVEELID